MQRKRIGMKDKYNIMSLGLICLTLLSLCINNPKSGDNSHPNVLFIAIDDMNDWTGFLGGHPQAITPNLDNLANMGVNFTNAHCPAPGCSPTLACIPAGRRKWL